MTSIITKAALALSVTGMLSVATPAFATPNSHAQVSAHVATGSDAAWEHGRGHGRGHHRGWKRGDRYEGRYNDRDYGNRDYDNRDYDNRGYYGEPVSSRTRTWRGDDGRYYCRRSNGTTGLLIGAAVGGVVGNEVAGRRGDRTLGVILGAAGGALLGREIDRSGSRCR